MRRWLKILLIAAIFMGVATPTHAQQRTDTPTARFFDASQHWVRGEFLEAYDALSDPLLVFGNPYSREFFDPTTGAYVQYFDKARFEYHPDAPAGKRVTISPLGTLVYRPSQLKPFEMNLDKNLCAASLYQGTTYHVCYAFKAFYDANGGAALFGLPISEYGTEGDRYVQYFERARFEYVPEFGEKQWVRLSLIGRIQFSASKKDPIYLQPENGRGDNAPRLININARAFVTRQPAAGQTLYLIVRDQSNQPVEGATATLVLHLDSKTTDTRMLPGATNQDGILQFTFDAPLLPANTLVPIEVQVDYGGAQCETSSWFRVWY